MSSIARGSLIDRLLDEQQRADWLWAWLPAKVRSRIEFSIRTSVATLLTMLLINYWEFSSFTLFLSPVISVIASTNYLGLWQLNTFHVAYGTVIGSGIGTLIGLTYQTKPLQVVLLFFGVLIINRFPGWDRLTIVLAGLSLILAAMMPTISNGGIPLLEIFYSTIAIMVIPFLITGVTLMLPYPSLAANASKMKVLLIARKLSWMSKSMMKAFISYDHLDLFCAEFEQLVVEIEDELEALKALIRLIDAEKNVFWGLEKMPAALQLFLAIADSLVGELQGLRDMLKNISYNHTQHKFAEQLSETMMEMSEEMELMLTMVAEYFQCFSQFAHPTQAFDSNSQQCLRKIKMIFQRCCNICSRSKENSKKEDGMNRRLEPDEGSLRSGLTYQEHPSYDPQHFSGLPSTNHSPRGRSMTQQHGFHHYSLNERDIESSELNSFKHRTAVKFRLDEMAGSESRHGIIRHDLSACISKMCHMRSRMLFDYTEVRKQFIFFDPQEIEQELHVKEPVLASDDHDAQDKSYYSSHEAISSGDQIALMIEEITLAEERRVLEHQLADISANPQQPAIDLPSPLLEAPPVVMERAHRAESQGGHRASIDHLASTAHLKLVDPHSSQHIHANPEQERQQTNLLKLSVREENIRLGLRNLGPRAAYLHRLSVVIEYMSSFNMVLDAVEDEVGEGADRDCGRHWLSCWSFLFDLWLIVWNFVVDHLLWTWSVFSYVYTACGRAVQGDGKRAVQETIDLVWGSVEGNALAIKVAAAVAIMGSLRIYNLLPSLYQGGLWSTLVIVLIRQESASSSFLMAYQRLEGTVIGSIYSFLVYQVFECQVHQCGMDVQIPCLILWLAVCQYFREGPQHGYSATVAGFTPILLTLGTEGNLAGAWGRIEETFFGIVLYLLIDNLILPKRTYPAIKASVMKCILETRIMISESILAMQTFVLMDKLVSPSRYGTKPTVGSPPEVATAAKISNPTLSAAVIEAMTGIYGNSTDVRFRSGSFLSSVVSASPVNPSRKRSASSAAYDPVTTRNNHFDSTTIFEEVQGIEGVELTMNDVISQRSNVYLDLFRTCKDRLDSSEKQLILMQQQLAQQKTLLRMVIFEPQLFYRSFPQHTYNKLHSSFQKVYRSGIALNSGSRALSVILCQMMKHGRDEITLHLDHFVYMTEHLFQISSKADQALQQAHEAFIRLYEEDDFDVDLDSLLALRSVCEGLLASAEDHFRTVYMRHPAHVLTTLNPYFLVAWQNVFESAVDLVRHLSDLGMSLHIVRNVEALVSL